MLAKSSLLSRNLLTFSQPQTVFLQTLRVVGAGQGLNITLLHL